MASWQYQNPSDKQPVVPTDRGYFVSFPKGDPDIKRGTAQLEFDGNTMEIWLHDIIMSFQNGGSFAQSHHYRQWYARNMTQPVVSVQGQTASQYQYGELVEFIRSSQIWALKPLDVDGKGNTVGFTIPESGIDSKGNHIHAHAHQGHHFRGHIKAIERKTSRFVNAPEFSFEFVIVTAYSGLFSISTGDPSATKDRIAMYMQIPNTIRSRNGKETGTVTFASDPDEGISPTKK